MRAIADGLLAGVFGVWLGLGTKIWEQPFDKMFLFIFFLGVEAVLLNLCIAPNLRNEKERPLFIAGLIVLGLSSGAAFQGWNLFDPSKQQAPTIFYYTLLITWFVIGYGAAYVEKTFIR